MCGRFVSSTPPDAVAQYFGATTVGERLLDTEDPAASEPSFNVAPTTDVLVVVEGADHVRRLDRFRWGLVPFWAKDRKIGNRLINARAETLAEKAAFRTSLRRRRCIVPADGFYEWTMLEGHSKKTPMYIRAVDGKPFAFAGLWETWRDPEQPDAPPLSSCTIITGAPNRTIAAIHDRMPVILPPDAWDLWLDPTVDDVPELESLFVPAPAESMTYHPVSTAVNNVRSAGAALISPVDPESESAA